MLIFADNRRPSHMVHLRVANLRGGVTQHRWNLLRSSISVNSAFSKSSATSEVCSGLSAFGFLVKIGVVGDPKSLTAVGPNSSPAY